MHLRALGLACSLVLIFYLLTACDLTGIPAGHSSTGFPQPTVTAQPVQPTGTPATLPTDSPVVALPTNTGVTLAQPTETADPAEVTPSVAGSSASAVPTQNSVADQELAQIEANTAKLRGLQPKGPVKDQFLTQQQLHDNLAADQEKNYTKEDARRDTTELWLLRLVDDRSLDLYQLQIDLLTEQVAGYYDPDKKELFVLGTQGALSPLARETLAHEFVHGLQDQYFDLNKLLPENSHAGDRDLAVRSLVEGDAQISGLMYAYRYMSSSDFQKMLDEIRNASTTVFDSAPQYIRDSLVFPYDAGQNFVSKLIEMGSFQQVNKAFRDPPTSTEQVMHPEKYTSSLRDQPIPVTLPPLTSTLGTGWKSTDQGTTGEFDAQELLKITGASNPEEAAAGWGGGSYAMYQNGDSALYIESLKWDTAKDADEFESALHETFANLTSDGANAWDDGSRYFALKHTQDEVTLISSTDKSALQKALGQVK